MFLIGFVGGPGNLVTMQTHSLKEQASELETTILQMSLRNTPVQKLGRPLSHSSRTWTPSLGLVLQQELDNEECFGKGQHM